MNDIDLIISIQALPLLHELIEASALIHPQRQALNAERSSLAYKDLWHNVTQIRGGLLGLRIGRGERVAIYLDKRIETVVACFGATAAGAGSVKGCRATVMGADQVVPWSVERITRSVLVALLLEVSSISSNVGATIVDNDSTGNVYGVVLWNLETTAGITTVTVPEEEVTRLQQVSEQVRQELIGKLYPKALLERVLALINP